MSNYYDLFGSIHTELAKYYHRWYFDRPMIVTSGRDRELQRITTLTNRFLHFYAGHYREYLDRIPYPDKVMRFLELQDERGPYHPGSARLDYLMDTDRNIKVCEFTSRFYGNGYYTSFFADLRGRQLAADVGVKVADNRMEELLESFVQPAEGYDRVCLLKGSNRLAAWKLFMPFFEAIGKKTSIIEVPEAEEEARRGTLDGTFLIGTFNQQDLLGCSEDTIKRFLDNNYHNDLRSVFLTHDKRIISLLFDDSVTSRFMTEEETAFLRDHYIVSWLYRGNEDIWEDARRNREKYILKHPCLGSSQMVYAGCMTSDEEWEKLFAEGTAKDMVLQPFIKQRSEMNRWEGRDYREYITGTILMNEDSYYGTGIFRTSSLEVLNKGDDRKIGYVLTDDIEAFGGKCILL